MEVGREFIAGWCAGKSRENYLFYKYSYPYSFQKATFFLCLKKSFRSTAWPFEISGQRSLLTLLIAKYIILFELL